MTEQGLRARAIPIRSIRCFLPFTARFVLFDQFLILDVWKQLIRFKFSYLFLHICLCVLKFSFIRFTDFLQPLVDGQPWGLKSSSNSDPYTDAPNTGVVRSYDFTLTRGVLSPDGFEKSTFLVNGQFPGVNLPKSLLVNVST